jgi:hypothetical protein
MKNIIVALVLATCLLLIIGCSGGNSVSAPEPLQENQQAAVASASHYIWGYWQGIIDPDAETIEFTQLREGNFHLNALGFLEPPPLVFLTLESLQFNGNLVTADIGLRHPFLGLTEFTGFDVCGIFISNGSVSGFNDAGLLMTGEGDTRLLNPDGYSRWWNPTEFPANGTIFGYKDGLLGAPDSFADFNGTLNGYKYFCNDLDDITDTMADVDPSGRGVFSAGQKNVRRYELEIGNEGLVFNYAVDASWQFPQGDPPYTAPDDFVPGANRTEAWNITVTELENTLYNDGIESGGDLSLSIDVYDWYNADLNTVRVESPGNFAMVESGMAAGGGIGYSTYEIDIVDTTPAEGSIDLLISIISEEEDWQNFITGVNTTAYFMYTAEVGSETPVEISVVWGNPIEMASLSTANDPHDDEISPCIMQETDNELKAFWYGYAPHDYGTFYNYYSSDIGAYSTNGINWNGNKDTFGTVSTGPGFQRADQAKMAPHQGGSCAVVSGVFSGFFMTLFDNDRVIKSWPTYTFNWIPNYVYNIEVMTDNTGYIYAVSDAGGNINGNKTSGPNVCSGSNSYMVYSGGDARLSHVRSWGCDSSNILWLAYGKTSLDGIYLAYGNDSSNTSWTTGYLVWSGSGYDDIRDPSMDLVNGVIHLSFVRHNTTSGEYELCYTYGDTTSGFSTPVVIDSSTSAIEDAHLQFGNYADHDIPGAAYMKESAIWFAFSADEGATWLPPETVQTLTEVAEDPDMIYINHTGGLTEDIIVIWVQGGGANNDCYTRMGHYVEG